MTDATEPKRRINLRIDRHTYQRLQELKRVYDIPSDSAAIRHMIDEAHERERDLVKSLRKLGVLRKAQR